jgi:hypothetical protein
MAFQNVVGNKLAQAEMNTAGYETIYTTPLLTRTYVKNIDICNTNGSVQRFYIHLVPKGNPANAGNSLFYNAPINGNTTVQWTGSEILTAGDTIQVQGSAAGIAVSITGGEAT